MFFFTCILLLYFYFDSEKKKKLIGLFFFFFFSCKLQQVYILLGCYKVAKVFRRIARALLGCLGWLLGGCLLTVHQISMIFLPFHQYITLHWRRETGSDTSLNWALHSTKTLDPKLKFQSDLDFSFSLNEHVKAQLSALVFSVEKLQHVLMCKAPRRPSQALHTKTRGFWHTIQGYKWRFYRKTHS